MVQHERVFDAQTASTHRRRVRRMSIWANLFSERYYLAIAQLAMLIEACPDEHWSAPVWQVQRTDRHV